MMILLNFDYFSVKKKFKKDDLIKTQMNTKYKNLNFEN